MTQQPPIMPGYPAQPSQGDWAPPPAKSRIILILIGAVVLVLVAAGLTFALFSGDGGKPTAASSLAPSVSATGPAGPVSFKSALDLRLALVAGGIACNSPEMVKHDGKGPAGLIDDTVICYRGSAELDLDVYDGAANASGRVAYQAELTKGLGLGPDWFAVGANWTVQCQTRADCEAVVGAIGGRVDSTPTDTVEATAAATTKPAAPTVYAKLTAREWKKLAKDPDAYAGKAYIVYGVVTQFDAATGADTFRADVDGVRHADQFDYDTNTILSNVKGDVSDLVEDDMFQASVIVVGSYSYETSLGGETTVPQLSVMKIKTLS